EGRRRLGGHPSLPHEADGGARGPDVQPQLVREGSDAAGDPEGRHRGRREVAGEGVLVRRLRLLQGRPGGLEAAMIPPGGSPSPRALPPASPGGALAHPAATGGALATEAPPVWAHPIPEEDAHFWDYWRVLVRHRWTVISFFLLAVVVGTV